MPAAGDGGAPQAVRPIWSHPFILPKTALISFGKPASCQEADVGNGTFDFLGFYPLLDEIAARLLSFREPGGKQPTPVLMRP